MKKLGPFFSDTWTLWLIPRKISQNAANLTRTSEEK